MGDPTHEPQANVSRPQNAGSSTGLGNTSSTSHASTSRAALQGELRQLDFQGNAARLAVVQARPAAGAQTEADRLPFHKMKLIQDDAAFEAELAAAGPPPRTPITRAFYEKVRAKYLADDPRRHQLAGQGLRVNGDFPTPTFTLKVVQWQETKRLAPTGFIEDSQLRSLAKGTHSPVAAALQHPGTLEGCAPSTASRPS